MTAIDAAVQTKRLGAEDVTIVYRRGGEQMGASRYEQELAQTDGVLIRHWARPSRSVPRTALVRAVELAARERRTAGSSIRAKPSTAGDQLFKAIGQAFVPQDLDGSRDVLELEGGRIAVDFERRTSVPGVWAGGDCVAGGKDLTVAAVEDGKQAALSIDRDAPGLRALAAA